MRGAKFLAVACVVLNPAIAMSGEDVSFERDVQPILEVNCAVCHSPGGVGYEKSGFGVQTYQSVMKGTKYGAIVNPGSSDTSNLVWLIEHRAHPSINMPKTCAKMAEDKQKCALASQSSRWLSTRELILIKEWVDEGAKDN